MNVKFWMQIYHTVLLTGKETVILLRHETETETEAEASQIQTNFRMNNE